MAKEKSENEITECCSPKKWQHHNNNALGGIYFFAMIGAAVYNVQQVSGFWPIVWALLRAIAWPAFLLHKVYSMLNM